MSNWVERRAIREQHLRNASTVWQDAKSAIDECCISFRERFPGIARVINQEQNGHRILIEVRFTFEPNTPRQISIKFSDEPEKQITVTVDGGGAVIFPIDADEHHAYIACEDKEISADEFTQMALEEALFKPPSSKSSPISVLKSGSY
jgi:hypothetical protein